MGARRCCVPGCSSTDVGPEKTILHSIRIHTPQITEQWLCKIQRTDLFKDMSRISSYVVCDRHFSDRQKFKGTGKHKTNLIYDAVPDQNLPMTTAEVTSPACEQMTTEQADAEGISPEILVSVEEDVLAEDLPAATEDVLIEVEEVDIVDIIPECLISVLL